MSIIPNVLLFSAEGLSFPSGTSSFRPAAQSPKTENGRFGCDLKVVSHEILRGKYALAGLLTVCAAEDDGAGTLSAVLEDPTVPRSCP